MVRTVIAEKRCERQWTYWYETNKFCYGLVIGLPSLSGPDYVIHIVDTKPAAADPAETASAAEAEERNVSSSSDAVPSSPEAAETNDSVLLNYDDLLEHALNALRMMPGNCYVLGLFTVERTMPALDSDSFKQQTKMLQKLSNDLQKNHWIYGSPDDYDSKDKFVLNYAGDGGVRCINVPCKADSPKTQLELQIEPHQIDWVSFYSQLAEPFEFRIARREDGSANIEENVFECIKTLNSRLRNSRIFMEADAALNAPGVSVSNYLKLHKNDTQTIRTRLYFEVEDPIDGQPYGATRHNGYIRCMGEVSACVFAHPTQMIADIDRYLRSDLMRSVCGRLRLFLDAYPDMADNERIHALSRLQPPRRVFFYPFLGSRIQFTDYLFDSEDAKVTVFNARHVFNVDITPYMVDQRREKMRLPTPKPIPDRSNEPEVPRLIRALIRGRNVSCNVALIMSLLSVFVGVSLFVLVRNNAEKDLLNHYF